MVEMNESIIVGMNEKPLVILLVTRSLSMHYACRGVGQAQLYLDDVSWSVGDDASAGDGWGWFALTRVLLPECLGDSAVAIHSLSSPTGMI